jgi:ParB/RepB/Spo0J family partition protein
MSVSTNHVGRFLGVEELDIAEISPNPRNPRLIFPEEELDRLAESISEQGILVPIVVFEDQTSGYVLLDGERRYKCAQRLGLPTVPALIADQQDDIENLITMFTIHQMQEPWRDIPTARALSQLAEAIETDERARPTDARLSQTTGLSVQRVRRLRFIVTLPSEYQEYVQEGSIPLNWFWELDQNVIKPLAKERKAIHDEFGVEEIRAAFVKKRIAGVIPDTVSLRKVRPIIKFASAEASGSPSGESILDGTIRDLIEDEDFTIDSAYEDTVQIMVEIDKLSRNAENFLKAINRLLHETRTDEERSRVISIAEYLCTQVAGLVAGHEAV